MESIIKYFNKIKNTENVKIFIINKNDIDTF